MAKIPAYRETVTVYDPRGISSRLPVYVVIGLIVLLAVPATRQLLFSTVARKKAPAKQAMAAKDEWIPEHLKKIKSPAMDNSSGSSLKRTFAKGAAPQRNYTVPQHRGQH